MANPVYNQALPTRPFPNLTRGGPGAFQSTTPYNAQNPYGAPAPNPGSFGAAGAQQTQQQQQQQQQQHQHQQQQRDAQRLERAERERREAFDREALDSLSDEQRDEINEAFSLFDLDKDTYIDYHELKVSFKALGFDLPKQELVSILQTHGVSASAVRSNIPPTAGAASSSGGGPPPPPPPPTSSKTATQTFSGPTRLLLSHTEFLTIAARKISERDPREEILRAFDLFDVEGKGRIELEDLRRVARELGEGLQEEELIAMIEEFDVRGEGGINREEFVGICLGG